MSASALICLAPGSEETEAVTTIDLLVRGGVKVNTASVASDGGLTIVCSRGVKLLADAPLVEVADGDFDIIVLPGGIKGAECFRDSPLLVETVRQFHLSGRIVAAICAAPATVLVPHQLFPIGNMTGFPALKEHIPADQWQDKRVVDALAKTHSAAAGQRMAGRHYDPHIHFGKRPHLQFAGGLRIEHDAEIRLAGDQRLLDVDIVDGGQCKRDVGIMFMHLFKHRRKEMPVNGIDSGDAHMPAPQPAQVIQLLAHPGKVLFPVICRVQEQLPGGRQAQSRRMALE